MHNIPTDLKAYIEAEIVPRYAAFDAAHGVAHVTAVIAASLKLADIINGSTDYRNADGTKTLVRHDMVYAIAAYHDTGLCADRATHHTVSARIICEDEHLKRWFTDDEITIMANAAEDHRASSRQAPRTLYGRIVAEADRAIDPIDIIRRTIQYGLAHYPALSPHEHYLRMVEHLQEKYAEGGYLRLWIPESPNATRLAELRAIIRSPHRLRQAFDELWQQLSTTL